MNDHDARVPVPAAAAQQPARATVQTGPTVRTPSAPVPVAGLTVGHADDPAEHLADRMADRALERLRTTGSEASGSERHAHTPGCGHLRRSVAPSPPVPPVVGREGGTLDIATSGDVEAARSGGAPLPAAVRRRMETGFGTGLGHVRVHDGPDAARLSASIGAEAFTTGRDIFFGAGRFAPDTPEGEQVLAHEIAHVIAEPTGVHRWPSWPFGKKKTPQEKAEAQRKKDEEAAEAARIKQEKAERAAHAKAGKSKVDQRRRTDKERRRKGQEGRAEIAAAQQGPGGAAVATANYAKFDEALLRERELFEQYVAAGTLDSDQARAELAYHTVWYEEFPELAAVRPPRETQAEKLTRQVRQVRTGAGAAETAEAADAEKLTVRMLPSEVESAYERMVRYRDELLEVEPGTSVVIAEEKAWATIRSTLAPKALAGFPERYGPLDLAAWQQAEERVAAREAQKSRDAKAAQTALALLPEDQRTGPQPKAEEGSTALESAQGFVAQGGEIATKIGEVHDDGIGALAPQMPSPSHEDIPLVSEVSGLVSASKAVGKKPGKEPEPDPPGAAEGIGHVTSILDGLMSAAVEAKNLARSASQAWNAKDPYAGLEASKSGANAVDGLVGAAKGAANTAKLIDSTVSSGVESVIPGLDLVASVTSMVRGVAEVAAAGMRQRETDAELFEARAATGRSGQIAVAVYPLMKMSAVYATNVQKAGWALGVSVMNFGTAVAQLASAGGLGIPAAIKAATTLVDKLHDLGRYIQKHVLAVIAKRVENESSVQHLEGAAEEELSRHPKMAVDGIVVEAAKGDPIALAFLANYRIDGKPITEDFVKQIKPKKVEPFDPSKQKSDPSALSAEFENDSEDPLLLKIRAAVLAGMNTDADPQTAFDDMREELRSRTSTLRGLKDGWSQTGELATERNTLAQEGRLGANTKTGRGIGWRLKQMLSSKRRAKLRHKTEAFAAQDQLPDGVAVAVGDAELRDDAMPAEIEEFARGLTIEAIEAEFRRTPRRNSPEWLEFLRNELVKKITERAQEAAGVAA